MGNQHIYEKSSVLNTTLTTLKDFHLNPKALSQLTPPPIFVQLVEDKRVSLTEGDLRFRLWFGFVPIEWHARHQAGVNQDSFADVMVSGPMESWRHEHIFEDLGDKVRLTDRVALAHKAGLQGIFTRLVFDGIPLRILFFYRHLRTKWATENKA